MRLRTLTKKQKRVYDYIVAYIEENDFSPSLQEIADNFDFLGYTSSARYYMGVLQKKGYLKRESNSPRAITVTKDVNLNIDFLINNTPSFVQVPILGAANAGTAIALAEEDAEGYLRVEKKLIKGRKKIFAIRISGDSMNQVKMGGKSIDDGDFVLIDPEHKNAENNDIVLSIIDGCANVKKFKRDAGKDIFLISKSTNKKYKPIHISSKDNFIVNGKVVEVIKR